MKALQRDQRTKLSGWKLVVAGLMGICLTMIPAIPVQGQTLLRDTNHSSMADVSDVTNGLKYLLRNDDLVLLQTTTHGSEVDTSVVNLDTTNSKIAGSTTTPIVGSRFGDAFDPTKGIPSSEAAGRMYNIKSDTIAVLTALDNQNTTRSNQDSWLLTLFDPFSGYKGETRLQTSFRPHGTVYTRVVMGNFMGDHLAEPLVFYAEDSSLGVLWGMKVLAAQDPASEGAPREGPEFAGNTLPPLEGTNTLAPLAGTIVVGDFNGDGKDEIAALMNDYQTIKFYSVNTDTLAITPISQPVNLHVKMRLGQVALTSGRFRNLSPSTTNADLVVFGQIEDNSKPGYSVIPIEIDADTNGDGGFSTQVVQQAPGADGSASEPFFRFPDYHAAYGAIAHAAPLINWPNQLQEQLVLGIQTQAGASYILIGDFQPYNNKLSKFNWYSTTEREYDGGDPIDDYLTSLSIGNFDHLNSDGTHNAGFQIQTQEYVTDLFGGMQPHVNLFDINLPVPAPPPPGRPVTNWLKQVDDYAIPNGYISYSDAGVAPRPDVLVTGDTQGRSLRLGSPTIVRINSQTQPDLILAIPPMHVDWVATHNPNSIFPGCDDPNTPCVANFSVKPSVPPSQGTSFSTAFKFSSTSSSTAARTSTTSWGISDKTTVGANFTFNDGFENASGSIKDATKLAHEQNVSKTWNTYNARTENLTDTTGFADHIFYTQRGVNVYYYPVLGCDTNGQNCTANNTSNPTYVEFSVPDHVVQADIDGTLQDWYQPVHEPGNVLSYPWSAQQLTGRFTSTVTPLTNSDCTAIGSNTSSSSTSWDNSSGTNQSSGSTNTFSNELSTSYSTGAGVKDVDNANVTFSFDVAANSSLSTLNQSTLSLSSSSGIFLTIPEFSTNECCSYGFKQYIFGLKGSNPSAAGGPCLKGQNPLTDQCVALNDPQSNPLTVATTGPLFTGYAAAFVNGTGDVSTCAGNSSYWQQIYTQPDVALNHPERWNWNKATQTVAFNPADTSTGGTSPLLQQFYAMKGFFITKKSASTGASSDTTLPASPNLEEAAANDQLVLTTRVYNYSLVDTPPNAKIVVRFYGQLYCPSNGDLCSNGFQIGQDQIIPAIAGFQSQDANDAPNWKLASVAFDPSAYPDTKNGNVYMLFWVVVWMQDGNGQLVAEMPDHGLTGLPDPAITQIKQVPIEAYSNNVGLYGVHQQFHLTPAGIPPGATGATGSLASIALTANPNLQLETRTVLTSTIQAAGAPVDSVSLAYYDGDPTKNGTLLDTQKIVHMEAGVGYKHNSYFTPATCGPHTLYSVAWLPDTPVIQAVATTNVTVDQSSLIQALITSTQNARIQDAQLRNTLLTLLNAAQQSYQQNQSSTAAGLLSVYMQELSAAGGSGGAAASNAAQLIGQAGVSLGCDASGFVLSTLTNSAAVNAGQSAAYTLAVTPSGGFQGAVGLSCTGAPQGAVCSLSTQNVTLDGVNQVQLKVSVSTSGSSVAAAGILPGSPRHYGFKWLLSAIAVLFAMSSLRSARLHFKLLACTFALLFCLTTTGCGGGSSTMGGNTPSGAYTLTVQGLSNATSNKTQIVLFVN